jgi:hypothetical protein
VIKKNSKLVSKFIIILVVILSLLFVMGSVSAVQLSQDDSTIDSNVISLDNNGYAVELTPARAGKISSIDAYLNRTGSNSWTRFFILDSNKNYLKRGGVSITDTGNFSWWNRTLNQEVLDSFYVGIVRVANSRQVELGVDTTSPNGVSWDTTDYNNPSSYILSPLDNYMLRANINYYPTVSNVLVNPDVTNYNPTLTATCTDYEYYINRAQYRIDGASWKNMTAADGNFNNMAENVTKTININSISDGNHLIEVRCRDANNNWSNSYGETTVFVDITDPVTTSTYNPTTPNGDNGWYVSGPAITLTATDVSGSGVDNLWYELSGATNDTYYQAYAAPYIIPTILNDGITTLKYKSLDNAGNFETETVETISVDRTDPTAPVMNAFNNDYLNSTSETISWTSATDAMSGIQYYNIYRSLNGGSPILIDDTNLIWYIDTGLITDNNYSYAITAVDNAGNEGNPSNNDWFVVDMNDPQTPTLDSLPAYTANAGDVDLSWNDVNDVGNYPSGVASYDINEDNSVTNVGLVLAYTDLGNADATTHNYNVRAVDDSNAPNTSDWSNTETTTIDLTAPITTSTLAPPTADGNNNWYVSPVTITLNATDPNSPSSGVNTTYYCRDDINTCNPTTIYTGPFVISNEGTNYVRYYSTDNVGNTETTKATNDFNIDTSDPYDQTIVLDDGNIYNTTGTVVADLNTGVDDISGLWYCNISWDVNTWNNIGLVTTDSHACVDGTQTTQYYCYDQAGNDSAIVQDDIIVDTVPPISDITSHVNTEEIIKGITLIEGTAFDLTSGLNYVQIKIEQPDNNNGWTTLLDWTTVTGTDNWDYNWTNGGLISSDYRISSRAVDNAGWTETNTDIVNDRIEISLTENNATIENVFYENNGKFVEVFGYLDRTNTVYTMDIIDLDQGQSSSALYTFPIMTDDRAEMSIDINVSSWDTEKLYAARIDINSSIIYSQFDTLAISNLRARVDNAENDLNIHEQRLDDLNQLVIDLNAVDQNLQDQIDDAVYRIDDINGRLVTLRTEYDAFVVQYNQDQNDIWTKFGEIDQNLTNIWNEINDLNTRLNALQDQVNAMNHATINVSYNATTNTLLVWGEAAHGATAITMDINSTDGMFSFTGYATTPNAENAYSYTIDTNAFAQKQYNITVTTDGIGGPHFAGALVLLGTGEYGFKELGYNTDFSYYYVPRPMPIDFTIRVYETGLHEIRVIGSSDTNYIINQVLFPAYTLSAGEDERPLGSEIIFPGDGNYVLYLHTKDIVSGLDYNSVEITVNVNDEAALLPDGNITIVSPPTNDNNHSVQANTFYTKEDFVLTAGLSGIDWGNDCPISYLYSGTQFTHLWDFGKVGSTCSGTVFINDINSGNEGLYLLRAKNYFAGGEKKDDLNVGFDYTAPSISNITPIEGSIINKIAYLKANVVDNLSGTDKVWFRIYTKDINNDNNVLMWAKQADYNIVLDKWETDFNTLEVPDGTYNVDVNAIDVAGNASSEFIDPMVDNTSPVIDVNSFVITPSPLVRNETLTIDVNVSDNLSGVDIVTATIRDSNANIVDTIILTGNGSYTGVFNTNSTWDTNTHTVTIDANDIAGNISTESKDVNVYKNYYFNIDNSASGTANISFSFDGNFRDDLNNVSTVDGNTILITSSIVTDINVEFDVNGLYTINTTLLGAGTYYIDLNYNTQDYNYTDQIVITVGPAPVIPGGGGSGGGGVSLDICGNNICSTTEDYNTCPTDCEAPEQPEKVPEPTEDRGLFPEGFGEPTLPTPTPPVVPAEPVVTVEPVVEQPQGPTGFFGLGPATDLGVGLIALLGVIGAVGIVWKRRI